MRCFARLCSPLRVRHLCASAPSPFHRFATTDIADASVPRPARSPRRPRPLKPQAKLTPEEIAQVHRLVPRLCDSGHLQEAVRLLDACLLTEPPLDSLPLPVLVRRLCGADEPGMSQAMALLTALLHNPRCSPGNIAAICSMLVDSYLEHGRPRDALKVFDWMSRPKSPCQPGADVCRKVVEGLCRHGRTVDALRVAREMVGERGCVGAVWADVRTCLHRSLLHDARVREAQELDGVLAGVEEGGEGACGRAVAVLDRMIKNWQD